ncbi:hypothetical protein [Haloarcula amylovorans]|uniref:hypothetical protein n=1 Tax=Haloarcula amylovorans TaxID=2562280 RepID=UPI00107636A5|nr:hypothetical protein [Halomicroarcula amylolytica]
MTTAYRLLDFVDSVDRELYFDPSFESKIMAPVPGNDEQDRQYQHLGKTEVYTLTSALAEARGDSPGPLSKSEFRIPDSTARKYLELMQGGEVADEIHDHSAASREVIVGLADADCLQPEDFISESVDHIDIAREAGLDRNIVGSIATQFVAGFSTGSEIRDTDGPFDDVTASDAFEGWSLQSAESGASTVRWVSQGRFNITVKESDGKCSVVINSPSPEKNPYYRKGRKVILDAENVTPAEAIQTAHDWLASNQLPDPEVSGLSELDYVGPSTHDYLALEYGVRSRDDLDELAATEPDVIEQVLREEAAEKLLN